MLDHPIFAGNPDRIAAWVWIVGKAAWKDTRQDLNGKTITVKRGQLLTSYRQMSKASGVSVKTLRTLVERLQGGNAIGTETGTGRLLITICNYDKYQSPSDSGGTARAQQGHSKGTQKNKGTNITIPPSEEADASQPVPVSVVTTALWNAGKQYLAPHGIKNPGSLIGRWLKTNSALEILNAIEAAQKAGTEDPIPYITETLKGEIHVSSKHSYGSTANGPGDRPDPAIEQIYRLSGLGQAPGDGRA